MDAMAESTKDRTSQSPEIRTAVGLVFTGDGVTEAQYQQVLNQTTPGNQLPPGLLYHAAGPSEHGMCVIEVWESQEAAQRFFDEHLGMALRDAKINVQPTSFRVINTMAV